MRQKVENYRKKPSRRQDDLAGSRLRPQQPSTVSFDILEFVAEFRVACLAMPFAEPQGTTREFPGFRINPPESPRRRCGSPSKGKHWSRCCRICTSRARRQMRDSQFRLGAGCWVPTGDLARCRRCRDRRVKRLVNKPRSYGPRSDLNSMPNRRRNGCRRARSTSD
jgi:hypothetical protein